MNKPQIVFLCHFSSSFVRERMNLDSFFLRRLYYKLRGVNRLYTDYGIWVSDYIEEFENHKDVEFHIISPHFGIKHQVEEFEANGIFYHFFRSNYNVLYTVMDKIFHVDERTNYAKNRKTINNLINKIAPDLIILCGAENPYYSLAVMDIKDRPIYLILQTFLNDPKRIIAKIASPYRTRMEVEVFKNSDYFNTDDPKEMAFINKCNDKAVFLPSGFPTHRPKIVLSKQKDYDFVFFARDVMVNKGIEDVLKAFALVKKKKPSVSLNVIGSVLNDYKHILSKIVNEGDIENNVHFSGFYESLQETYNAVVKAKVVVLPGITAPLNSTVRESMFIGMPTVVYETSATPVINEEKTCLFVAKMQDVDDLAKQMLLALEDENLRNNVAHNGKEYATITFGNEVIVNKLIENCKKIIDREI